MKPDQQHDTPQPVDTAGSDWQQQAVSAAQAAAQPTNQGAPKVPDWQQGFIRQGEKPDPQADILDMLAPADAKEPEPVNTPAPQPVQQPETPVGTGVVMGTFGESVPTTPVVGTGGPSTGKKVAVALLMLIVVLGAAAAGYFFFLNK